MFLKFAIIAGVLTLSLSAVMHSHSSNLNKEREADGAFSPRDKTHRSDSGEHNIDFDHEAILGSHKEAEEFDHLPPDEAKRRLKILLGKMDLNKDNQIDRNELKAWLLRSFKMLSEEEAQERLEDADEDGDGYVTWQEYVVDSYGFDGSDENFSDENHQLIDDDKDMWKVADVNMDGSLSADEWIAFSHPEEHPSMLPVILSHTLRDKDTDGDGTINFQEYIGDRAKEQSKDWLIAEKEKFDRELDKDEDGKLTGNEILSWMVPSNEEIAEEETVHLFASSDDDHDDILSFEEILEHHDIFVGSEATDYGEHLHNIHHFEDEL